MFQRLVKKQWGRNLIALPLIILMTLGVVGTVAYVMAQNPQASMVTSHWQYYPEETAFYIELDANKELIDQFFQGVDSLASASAEKNGTPSPMPEFAKRYSEWFKPQFSFGLWETPQTGQSEPGMAKLSSMQMLVTLNTQDNFDLETFLNETTKGATRFEYDQQGPILRAKAFSKAMDTPNAKPKAAFAVVENQLLISPDAAGIDRALNRLEAHRNIMRVNSLRDAIGNLPSDRRGTYILDLTKLSVMNDLASLSMPDLAEKTQKAVPVDLKKAMQLQKQLMGIGGVTVGSIAWNDHMLMIDQHTPLKMQQFTQPGLKEALMSILMRQSDLDYSQYLEGDTLGYIALTGLAQYYDIYKDYLASETGLSQIKSIEDQLSLFNIDFRTQILGLVDGAVGIAFTPELVDKQGQEGWQAFLNYDNEVDELLRKLNRIGQSPAFQEKLNVVSEELSPAQKLYTFKEPDKNFELAMTPTGLDTLLMGPTVTVKDALNPVTVSSPTLRQNKPYQDMMATLPVEKNVFYFLNIAKIRSLLAEQADKSSNAKNKEEMEQFVGFLSHFDSLVGATSAESDHLLKSYVRIRFSDPASQASQSGSYKHLRR